MKMLLEPRNVAEQHPLSRASVDVDSKTQNPSQMQSVFDQPFAR